MIELGLYEQIINKLFEVKLDELSQHEYFIGKRSITKDNVAKYLSRYLFGLFEEVFSQQTYKVCLMISLMMNCSVMR